MQHSISDLFAPILSARFPPGTGFSTHERINIFVALPMDPQSNVYRSKVGQFIIDSGVVDAVMAAADAGDMATVERVAQYCADRIADRQLAWGTPYSTFRVRIDRQALAKPVQG